MAVSTSDPDSQSALLETVAYAIQRRAKLAPIESRYSIVSAQSVAAGGFPSMGHGLAAKRSLRALHKRIERRWSELRRDHLSTGGRTGSYNPDYSAITDAVVLRISQIPVEAFSADQLREVSTAIKRTRDLTRHSKPIPMPPAPDCKGAIRSVSAELEELRVRGGAPNTLTRSRTSGYYYLAGIAERFSSNNPLGFEPDDNVPKTNGIGVPLALEGLATVLEQRDGVHLKSLANLVETRKAAEAWEAARVTNNVADLAGQVATALDALELRVDRALTAHRSATSEILGRSGPHEGHGAERNGPGRS